MAEPWLLPGLTPSKIKECLECQDADWQMTSDTHRLCDIFASLWLYNRAFYTLLEVSLKGLDFLALNGQKQLDL